MKTPWVWILGLQLALVLPFIGQPIHLDDNIYIDIGRNALKVPWQPLDFPYCSEGACAPDMGSHSHPPFLGYWIGLLIWLFGDGPQLNTTLHLGFLIFPLMFAAGMYLLAVRFAVQPLLTAAVAVASPIAVVMSHNLMPDYPTLAFWTLGMALYVRGVDEKKATLLWLSAILVTLAAFCSYPALVAVGLCWLYAWLQKSKMRAAFWAPFLPIVWMGAWLTYSSLYFGRFVIGGTARYFLQTKGSLHAGALTNKLLEFPIELAILALLLPLIVAALRQFKGRTAILWVLMSAALAQIYAANYTLPERLLVVLFLTIGGWTVLGLLFCIQKFWVEQPSSESRNEVFFLTIWAAVVTAIVLFVYAYAACRYLLPLLPPMVLLSFSRLRGTMRPNLRRLGFASLSIALVVALFLSAADFEMARVHRDIARSLGAALKGWESETRFDGEWGFRHYMFEQGFRQFLPTSNDLAGGQFVVSPLEATPSDLPQDVRAMLVPVSQKTWQSRLPIRMMNGKSHAGFYSSGWGLLPFSISRSPVEAITVQQVSYLVERLPEIILESPGRDDIVIPRPSAGGGVELVIPVPSRLKVPYNGPKATRVRFSCDYPVRVYYDHGGQRSEVPLQREADATSFELPDSPGVIVLETAAAEMPATAVRYAVIANWLMLPSGGMP